MSRERFQAEMVSVQQDFLKLCDLSIGRLEEAFTALINKNVEAAEDIVKRDSEINHAEEDINDRVILLLTRQQPVATDLRRLVVLLKAAADMERVGDYAVNIAKETIHIGNDPFVTSIELLEDMCTKSTQMLRQIVQAFVDENTTKAKELAELDDQIDEMYGNMIKHLLRLTSIKPESIAQITYLSFICRYIERCADLATNLAEYLLYLKKGQRFDLNN